MKVRSALSHIKRNPALAVLIPSGLDVHIFSWSLRDLLDLVIKLTPRISVLPGSGNWV